MYDLKFRTVHDELGKQYRKADIMLGLSNEMGINKNI